MHLQAASQPAGREREPASRSICAEMRTTCVEVPTTFSRANWLEVPQRHVRLLHFLEMQNWLHACAAFAWRFTDGSSGGTALATSGRSATRAHKSSPRAGGREGR